MIIKPKPTVEDYLSKLDKNTAYITLDSNYIEQQEASINYRPEVRLRALTNKGIPLELPDDVVNKGISRVITREKLMEVIGIVKPNEVTLDLTEVQNNINQLGLQIESNANQIRSSIRDLGVLKENTDTQKQQITGLQVAKNNLSSAIEQVNTTIIQNNEAITQQINQVKSELGNSINAKVNEVKQTIASNKQAQATKITDIESQLNHTKGKISELLQADSDLQGTVTTKINQVKSELNQSQLSAISKVNQEIQTKSNLWNTTSQKVSALESNYNGALSKITQLEKTISDNKQSLAQQVNVLQTGLSKISVGGRNLILNSDRELTVNQIEALRLNELSFTPVDYFWSSVDTITLSFDIETSSVVLNNNSVLGLELKVTYLDNSTGFISALLTKFYQGRYSKTVTLVKSIKEINHIKLIIKGVQVSKPIKLSKPKLEVGNTATAWTPAYEDILDKSNAKLEEYKQAQSTVNQNLTQLLTSLRSTLENSQAEIQRVERALTTKTETLSESSNRLSAGLDTITNKLAWKKFNTPINLNTLVVDGNYYLLASDNKVSPITGSGLYVIVNALDVNTVTQTLWQANTPSVRYTRTKRATTWGSWEKSLTNHEINALVNEERKARTTAEATTAQKLTELQAKQTNDKNDITAQITALQKADTDLTQSVSVVRTELTNQFTTGLNTTNSRIDTINTTITNKDRALTTKLAELTSAFKSADDKVKQETNSKITEVSQTLNNKEQALAQQITGLTAKYTQANNKIDTNKRTTDSAITTEQQARTNADNALSERITRLDSEYKTADRSISSKITQVEKTVSDANKAIATTKTELNSKFNNLKIGGRNLLLHTEKLNQLWRVASFDGQTTMTVNNGIAVITGKNNGWKHLGYDISLSKAQELLQTDTNFTLSVYIRRVSGANNPINIALRKGITNGFIDHLVGGNVTPTNTWVRYIVKGTMAAYDLKYFFVRFEWSDNSVYEFKQPKLEFGLHVTGWTPAPEDTNALIETTQANLNEFKQTQATKDSANSQKLTQLQASLNTVDNRTKWQEINTVTDLNNLKEQGNYFIKQSNNPNAPTANWIYITVDKANNARIRQTVWADNYAHQRFTRLWTDNRWHNWEQTPSSADVNNKASASALNDLKTTVNNVNNKVTAEANKTNQLQTNLNNQTNKITEQTRSIDGIKAIKAVTVDNNGVLSGYGLISELQNGRITSKFGINADQFYIGNPNNNKKLFNVYTTPQNINGVMIPAGTYLDSAFIAKGSINMLHISDSIQSDNYVANKTGWKLFKNGRFEINGTANNGARLVINNTGLTIYYNGNQKALELSIEL